MGRVICTISKKTGQPTIKAEGHAGPVCTQKTKPFIDKLGQVISDTPTEEMHMMPEITVEQTETHGS